VKPIIFSAQSARATLEDRQHQTRRVIRPQPFKPDSAHDWRWEPGGMLCYEDYFRERAPSYCPFGQVGSRLWVKERALYWTGGAGGTSNIAYAEDPEIPHLLEDNNTLLMARESTNILAGEPVLGKWKWKSSRFMPRWASRITLEITGVRVQKIQEISRADTEAEGVGCNWQPDTNQFATFQRLWDSLNKARGYSFDSDPWCWCLEFKRVEVTRE